MELKIKKPVVTEYSFVLDSKDPLGTNCTWAKFYLNEETYNLSIESDCGNYSYTWKPTPDSESFYKLISRLDKEYLLDKISNRNTINLKETIESILKNISTTDNFLFNMSKKQQKEIIEEIKEVNYCEEYSYYMELRSILKKYNIDYIDDCIDIIKDYPTRAIIICDFFKLYLVPEIKKMLLS